MADQDSTSDNDKTWILENVRFIVLNDTPEKKTLAFGDAAQLSKKHPGSKQLTTDEMLDIVNAGIKPGTVYVATKESVEKGI